MCLGVSPAHSAAVGRMLNLRTGKITPQHHVVHDELFTTVQGRLQYDALDPATWNELLELSGLPRPPGLVFARLRLMTSQVTDVR